MTFGDYWSPSVRAATDICCKEALALYLVLQSVIDMLWDRRVDVEVDSQSLYNAWTRQRARSPNLARILKLIFALTLEVNFDLKLQWVPTEMNRADLPSRELSKADARLAKPLWLLLQTELGGDTGFSWDLMALPSNVPRGWDDRPLKFFSRFPVPGTSGVNIFAQPCLRGEELYVFPPFVLIPSLIKLFLEWGDVVVTLVVPKHSQPRSWWPYLKSFAGRSLRISEAGQVGVLEYPAREGYVPNTVGLPFELWALRCFFPRDAQLVKEVQLPQQHSVLMVSDSMLRGLNSLSWPVCLSVRQIVFGGARMETLCRSLASLCMAQKPEVAVLHGGINNFSRSADCREGVKLLLEVFSSAARQLCRTYPEVRFVMSGICQTRNSRVNCSVATANAGLKEICQEVGWHFLPNDFITQNDLADEVHLSLWGSLKLHRRLQMFLRSFLGLRTGFDVDLGN